MGLSHTAGQTVYYFGKSDVGMVREENQDGFLIHAPQESKEAKSKGLLMVLADGMGGLAHGATASQIAVNSVRDAYFGGEGGPAELLVKAAKEANSKIFQEAKRLPGNQPMGSTLTALALLEGRAVVAQVGDSRAYRISKNEGLKQLTRDHTLVQELADRGEIEPDSLPYLMHRNVLTRGLGLQEDVEVDLVEIPEVKNGETFLICSDGLYDVVADSEIESRVIAHGALQTDLVDDVIDLARSRGAPDNVTVLVARVEKNTSAQGAQGFSSGSRDAEWDGVERRALGFLPQSLFVFISYFVVFALGALLALDFEEGPTSHADVRDSVKTLLGNRQVREFQAGEQDPQLKKELSRLLKWMEEESKAKE